MCSKTSQAINHLKYVKDVFIKMGYQTKIFLVLKLKTLHPDELNQEINNIN